ncbi:MAG: SDR family oxidoreductase [Rhodospirillaceae bacterium]
MTAHTPTVVMITGATGGFGTALANAYAGLGCRLVLTGRRLERLQTLAESLASTPVHYAAFDVRDSAATRHAVDGLPEPFAAVDLLINNAGLALGAEPAQQAALEDWEVMIDTNVKGLVAVTHMLLPGMIARGRGHIVNIGSTAGSYPYPGGNVYCASKAFVKQFSLALRADLIGTPVRVTDIEPGMVGGSEFSLVRYKGDTEKAARVYAGTEPLTPDDVTEAVLWCTTLPPRVNINRIELMPTAQAPGPLVVHRRPGAS